MFTVLSEKNCMLDISQRNKLNILLSWTADSQNFVDAAYKMWVTKVRHVASRYAPNKNGRMIGSRPGPRSCPSAYDLAGHDNRRNAYNIHCQAKTYGQIIAVRRRTLASIRRICRHLHTKSRLILNISQSKAGL